LLRFIVQTNQSFATVNHPALANLYRSVDGISPFKDRGTLRRFAENRFNEVRREQRDELKETCQTLALAFDGWSSPNHKHIIGAVAYWIGPDWQRHRMNVEFAEAVYGKSGEAMADVL
jgi:hypothetical protein